MRRAILAAASVLAGLVLSGCNEQFEVEMKPKDEGMERTIRVFKKESSSPYAPLKTVDADGKTLERVRDLYKQQGEADAAGKKVFKILLCDSHVNLDGGTARFVRLASDLGTASFYSESFDRTDDLAGEMEEQLEKADRLADMLCEWFELELKEEKRAKVLLDWVDNDFRKDLKNLIVYVKILSKQRDQHLLEENLARVASYLVNHGYLTKDDAPRLTRAILNLESAEGDQEIFKWQQRFVARRMGIPDDQPVPESLAFLGNREKLVASMQSKLCKTKTYLALKAKGTLKEPDPMAPENPSLGEQVFLTLISSLFSIDLNLFGSNPTWDVSLKVQVQPFWTNGKWKSEDRTVLWDQFTADQKDAPFIYAAWAMPSGRQNERFGHVLLQGASLAGYALWYQALHENERAEWTAFVDTIKPGDDVAKELESFRFKGEKALDEKEVKPALSNAARDIFREALAPEAPTQQEKP